VAQWVTALFTDSDYGRQLGVMEDIRHDLETLEERLHGTDSAGNDVVTGRILVLIDDLDRCEPAKAVEVLQAVNLLLNFKSFIVCLGIDARIVTGAVEKHYEGLLGEAGASGYEYLDKIVQNTTVRASAAIAEHYLQRGDRVSLMEYGATARRLRAATGRRQYLTVLEWLLDVRPDEADQVAATYQNVFGVHHVSSDALVMVLTPLVDPRSADMLAQLTQSGRYTVAVDTMPARLESPQRGPLTPLATRLWRIERENVLGRLREHGVPVVAWAGSGSLDLVLRDVARMASAPRGR